MFKLFDDKIATLSKVSNVGVNLAPSLITIGAQQYSLLNGASLSTATIGLGGVDAAIQPWKLYYVYAVVSAGVANLVASANSTSPAGFAQSKIIGYFDTDGSSQIISASINLIGAVGDYKNAHMTESQFQLMNGPGWILADGRNVAGSAWANMQSVTNIPDARGVVLRGKDNGRGADSERALGAYQTDSVADHVHGYTAAYTSGYGAAGGPAGFNAFANLTGATTGGASNGAPETRMRNISTNTFIKIN